MYTDYILFFQLAGIMLLLIYDWRILLHLEKEKVLKNKVIFKQISRDPSSAVELKDVESNKGVKIDD